MWRKKFINILCILFLLGILASQSFGENRLEKRWDYSVESKIYSLKVDDLNFDNESEIIFATENKLYILDSNGNLKNSFPINSKGIPYALETGEFSGDNETKEIVLGFGWRERFPVRREYFNKTAEGGLGEIDSVLYSKLLNLGEIQIFDAEKGLIESKEVDEWIHDISISDLDSNGENEIILATGGFNKYYYEEWISAGAETKCSDFNYSSYKPTGYECDLVYIEGLYCYTNCIPIENFTTTTSVIEEPKNESIEKKEFFEEIIWKGSIIIFSKNLSLVANKSYSNSVIWSCYVANLYNELSLEILAGSSPSGEVYPSGKVYCLDKNLTQLWEYATSGEVKHLWAGDLDDDGLSEIVIGLISPGHSDIEWIDRNGAGFLNFRLPIGETLMALEVGNLEEDDEKEIILASNRNLYIIDMNGKKKFKQEISKIGKVAIEDIDGDGYGEILISRETTVYCYSLVKMFLKKNKADSLYERAVDNSPINFTLAKEYVVEARKIYEEINDTDGIEKCDILLYELNTKIWDKTKTEGDNLYAKAISLFVFEDYEQAKEYVEKAREIYKKINDTEGVEKCNEMLSKIDEITKTTLETSSTIEETSSTSSTLITTSTIKTQENVVNVSHIIPSILVIFLILAIFLRFKWKKEEEEFE